MKFFLWSFFRPANYMHGFFGAFSVYGIRVSGIYDRRSMVTDNIHGQQTGGRHIVSKSGGSVGEGSG